jgi:hypothetical protein
VRPHANLTAKCPPVRPFEGKTADDLIGDYLELVGMYRECATRHAGLVDSL